MTWLILGLVLWSAGHFLKPALPDLRARMGGAGKGVAALLILGGLVLMVLGYRAAPVDQVYDTPGWARHLNNLLMLVAVYLFAVSGAKSRLHRHLRHPMLTGALVWSVAHLIVNGDAASIVLFGGVGLWALAEMVVINRRAPDWTPPPPRPVAVEIRALVITLVVYGVIAALHVWIGPSPFS